MKYIMLLLELLLLIFKIIISLGLFQQNGYKTKKYIINIKQQYFKNSSSYLEYLALIILFLFNFNNYWHLGLLLIIILLLNLLFIKTLTIKLKITKRIIRLLLTIIILLFIPYCLFDYHLLILLIQDIIFPFIIILAAIINKPAERIIYNYYLRKSKNKLIKINPIIIGITGSYGKTSTKNILHSVTENMYYTYSTPKSYNTPMGICKAINQMNEETEVFITELGATTPCDIQEIVSFVPVNIGIITDIGPQHIESFKTIENVLKTKLEILKSEKINTLIINNDNKYLREYNYPIDIKIITIGINTISDFTSKNIVLSNEGLSFDVYYREKYLLDVKTSLLGRHNIYNILLATACSINLGICVEEIKKRIANIKSIDNRLSLTNYGNIQILNDAFNSNIIGFKNAVEVLKLSKKNKIIITPGLVDLGKMLDVANKEIGKYLIEGIDYVYLVENEASFYIKNYFNEKAFINFEMVASFKEAYNKALKKYTEAIILIENDLPDNYLRR